VVTAAEPRRPEGRLRTRLSSIAPGLLAAAAIAVLARLLTGYLPSSIADVSVALLLGIVIGQASAPRAGSLAAGATFAAQLLLRAGIVLLGARLSLDQVVAIGTPAALIVVVTMTVVFTAVLVLARAARVEATLAVLLAVGTAVCGNSAIIATAPVLGARGREVAYAVATITLFGTLAIFLYPVIGHLLGMRDPAFGLWSGVAVNDTSQVVAASSSYSPDALEIATVVKLIRNALMAPLLILIAWGWTRRTGSERRSVAGFRRAVPVFVLGFVAMAGLRTSGLIQPALASDLDVAARWLILTALAGVGLSIRVGDLRAVGPRPLGVGLAAAVAAGAATVTAIVAFDLGSTIHP
jgi:uncharacterized integral membrane protein (TIGR00698 family)